jgi:hypothetical protein
MDISLDKSEKMLLLKQLSIDLMSAWKEKNSAALSDLIHQDFVFVNDTIRNFAVNKEKWMEWLIEKFDLVTFSYDFQKIEFICEGKVGLVVAKLTTLSLPNYSKMQRQYLVTDVWIDADNNDQWKLILRQPVSSEYL